MIAFEPAPPVASSPSELELVDELSADPSLFKTKVGLSLAAAAAAATSRICAWLIDNRLLKIERTVLRIVAPSDCLLPAANKAGWLVTGGASTNGACITD